MGLLPSTTELKVQGGAQRCGTAGAHAADNVTGWQEGAYKGKAGRHT